MGTASLPITLLSGMGADASIFKAQKIALSQLVAPEWPTPQPNDAMSTYVHRLTKQLAAGVPCIVGGASFGGIIALQLMKHRDIRACFLIGNVLSFADIKSCLSNELQPQFDSFLSRVIFNLDAKAKYRVNTRRLSA